MRAPCLVMVALLLGPFGVVSAQEEAQCVRDSIAKRNQGTSFGIASADAEQIVAEVARSIGLRRPITVVPCSYAQKAAAWSADANSGLPQGEYIVYNPDWVREVLGKDRIQAIALFGHELGHFLNGDFTVRKGLARREKERDADRFSGCAVARLGGDFSRLEDLLSRLRLEKDSVYPDRLTSIESAREGFTSCRGSSAPDAAASGTRKTPPPPAASASGTRSAVSIPLLALGSDSSLAFKNPAAKNPRLRPFKDGSYLEYEQDLLGRVFVARQKIEVGGRTAENNATLLWWNNALRDRTTTVDGANKRVTGSSEQDLSAARQDCSSEKVDQLVQLAITQWGNVPQFDQPKTTDTSNTLEDFPNCGRQYWDCRKSQTQTTYSYRFTFSDKSRADLIVQLTNGSQGQWDNVGATWLRDWSQCSVTVQISR